MSARRPFNTAPTFWNGLALLVVVAFAWKASFAEIGPAETRPDRIGDRLGDRAVVQRSQWESRRARARQKEQPAAVSAAMVRARRLGSIEPRASGANAPVIEMLGERLLSLPPPGR
ncbi:MAG: hypothetical protein ACOYN0_09030 [Phycisphaerales bacterium]